MMVNQINNRINAVDEIKGLCMLLVFIGHSFLSSFFNYIFKNSMKKENF